MSKILNYAVIGQGLSQFGSYMTSFTLRMRVLETSELSVMLYSLLGICDILPPLLLSPLIGILIDKLNRKHLLILTDTFAVCCTIYLFLAPEITVKMIIWVTGINSVINSIQTVIWSATIPLIAPPDRMSTMTGYNELFNGIAQLLSPAVSSLLIADFTRGLSAVFFIDTATCLIGVSSICLLRFPEVSPEIIPTQRVNHSIRFFLKESLEGYHYLLFRSELLTLLKVFTISCFVNSFVFKLIPSVIIGFADAQTFGYICSFGGIGMIISSLSMSIWEGAQPSRRFRVVAVSIFLQGFVMQSSLWQPNIIVLTTTAFVFLAMNTLAAAHVECVFQTQVPPELQGRVFSVKNACERVGLLFGMALSGILADYVFEPLLQNEDSLLAGSFVAAFMGLGKGRGLALLFALLGQISMVTAVVFVRTFQHSWVHAKSQ